MSRPCSRPETITCICGASYKWSWYKGSHTTWTGSHQLHQSAKQVYWEKATHCKNWEHMVSCSWANMIKTPHWWQGNYLAMPCNTYVWFDYAYQREQEKVHSCKLKKFRKTLHIRRRPPMRLLVLSGLNSKTDLLQASYHIQMLWHSSGHGQLSKERWSVPSVGGPTSSSKCRRLCCSHLLRQVTADIQMVATLHGSGVSGLPLVLDRYTNQMESIRSSCQDQHFPAFSIPHGDLVSVWEIHGWGEMV